MTLGSLRIMIGTLALIGAVLLVHAGITYQSHGCTDDPTVRGPRNCYYQGDPSDTA